jgi:SH3 domain protein
MAKRIILITTFIYLSLSIISTGWAEPRQYITDDLTIPMRTGTTNNHKILKFLNSGTAVLIKEVTADGNHAWIMLAEDNNKLGWVETKHLQDQPVASKRIISINKKNAAMRDKNKSLKKQITELKLTLKKLKKENQHLQSKKQELINTLSQLRESAARPIETAEENIRLQQTIAEQNKSNKELLYKVAILSDKNIKEWFLIGGGVAIGSLILGLLLTRISWKRKDGWSGGL